MAANSSHGATFEANFWVPRAIALGTQRGKQINTPKQTMAHPDGSRYPSLMSDKLSATIAAEALPREITALMSHRPAPGTRFRITVEAAEETEAEKLERLRTHIGQSLREADQGELIEEEAVFGPLLAQYCTPNPT